MDDNKKLKMEIAGYCRISVDEELDRDNTSIENQKDMIQNYVKRIFPKCTLTFYEDRDRSGYTFEQRDGYQKLRKRMMNGEIKILIVKDFSRFARRNSKGLVELEDLRDAGVRIISIGDAIDYPTNDDWTAIQFRFLINEMPITDASKKVRGVIRRKQEDAQWINTVPYGYVITNQKKNTFEIVPDEAEVIRNIFQWYNDGWGYKKIANHLTDQHIPTPRMKERERIEARGDDYKRTCKPEWSIITVSGILTNDFYIGTLRQHKYQRNKINGDNVKLGEDHHIVFQKHHPAIVDDQVFAYAQQELQKRSKTNYRGVKKYDTAYSGFLFCGDCGSPMFSMSRSDLAPAYTCGTYHKRGLKGCTSHHTRVDFLDKVLKKYVRTVQENSSEILEELEKSIAQESDSVRENENLIAVLTRQLQAAKDELKATAKRKIREISKNPADEDLIEETYSEIETEIKDRIYGYQSQIETASDKRNDIIEANRVKKTVLDVFEHILTKDKLDKMDIGLIVERIEVFENRKVNVRLKSDIDTLLRIGGLPHEVSLENFSLDSAERPLSEQFVVKTRNQPEKTYTVHVICNGDPLEIFTDSDGVVIFKKYSPVGELSDFASQYVEVLSKTANLPALVVDRDHVVAAAGVSRKEFLERRVTPELEEYINARHKFVSGKDEPTVQPVEGVNRPASIIFPIIASSDVTGAVVLLQDEHAQPPGETEIKLTQAAASFLGKQMET